MLNLLMNICQWGPKTETLGALLWVNTALTTTIHIVQDSHRQYLHLYFKQMIVPHLSGIFQRKTSGHCMAL